MPDNPFIFWILTAVVMMCFLSYKHWERIRRHSGSRQPSQREGDVIDVAPLRPRLEELRRNYATAAHAHARGIKTREGLVANARRKLGSARFLTQRRRDAEDAEDAEKHRN